MKEKSIITEKNIKYQRIKCNELKIDIIEIQSQEDCIKKGNTRKIRNKKKNI